MALVIVAILLTAIVVGVIVWGNRPPKRSSDGVSWKTHRELQSRGTEMARLLDRGASDPMSRVTGSWEDEARRLTTEWWENL